MECHEHLLTTKEKNMTKMLYVGNSGGKTRQGRHRKWWLADVENNLRYMAVRRWRMKAFLRKEGRSRL